MDLGLLQVVLVIVLWATEIKQKNVPLSLYKAPFMCIDSKKKTVFLTVSIGVLSRGRFTPPGVKVGLKDTERFPDTDAAAGTTSFCTGGRVESI